MPSQTERSDNKAAQVTPSSRRPTLRLSGPGDFDDCYDSLVQTCQNCQLVIQVVPYGNKALS
jgi:hypothetical protein